MPHRQNKARHVVAVTLFEALVAVVLIGILVVVLVPFCTRVADDGRVRTTAMVARAMMRKATAARSATGSYPSTLSADMFAPGRLPQNMLSPNVTEPAFDISTDAHQQHPANKTSRSNVVWWYNSANGTVRALVPDVGTAAEKIALYNAVNNTSITELAAE
jgi:type II secretory pathway pseudopilin PulG